MSRGLCLGWFYLRSLLPKTKRFSFRLGRGEAGEVMAVGYVALVTPDAPVIDGWQGLQLSPRHPAVNYCPSARHPHISSSSYLLSYSGYGTRVLCTGEECASTCVILQIDLCLSKPACLIHATCRRATMLMTVFFICSHSKYQKVNHVLRRWQTCSGNDNTDLTLYTSLWCVRYRMCMQTELCKDFLFLQGSRVAEILILKLCTSVSPSYLRLPQVDSVTHNQSGSLVGIKGRSDSFPLPLTTTEEDKEGNRKMGFDIRPVVFLCLQSLHTFPLSVWVLLLLVTVLRQACWTGNSKYSEGVMVGGLFMWSCNKLVAWPRCSPAFWQVAGLQQPSNPECSTGG